MCEVHAVKHELVKHGICPVCCLLHSNQIGFGAHPASYSVILPGALYPCVKFLGHEAGHSPASSVKVKNEWNFTTTLPHTIMVYKGANLPLPFTHLP